MIHFKPNHLFHHSPISPNHTHPHFVDKTPKTTNKRSQMETTIENQGNTLGLEVENQNGSVVIVGIEPNSSSSRSVLKVHDIVSPSPLSKCATVEELSNYLLNQSGHPSTTFYRWVPIGSIIETQSGARSSKMTHLGVVSEYNATKQLYFVFGLKQVTLFGPSDQ